MSIYTYIWCALNNPDPYEACFWGAREHPHYHDCKNCSHVADKSCEYGVNQKQQEELQKLMAEVKEMLAAHPKLDPKRLP